MRPRAAGPPTLVVLRALGLGDLLTAVPALRALAEAFPAHRRLLAAPRALAPLVELIDTGDGGTAIHRVCDTAALAPLPREARHAAVAVNLHGRGPESHRLLLAGQPGRMIAFRHPAVPESANGPRWLAGEHEVRRWCRLLDESGIAADPRRLDLRPPLADGIAATARGATVIHPGAADPARRWPPQRWAAVARHECRRGQRVLLTGSAGEAGLAGAIAREAGVPAGQVLAGRTDLHRLASVVAAAGRVVCGDTGVGHLATALGTPSVLVFGPTSPAEWGPPPDRRAHRALWAGRTGDPHGMAPDPGLLAIGVEAVAAALDELAERSAAPRPALAAAPSRISPQGPSDRLVSGRT